MGVIAALLVGVALWLWLGTSVRRRLSTLTSTSPSSKEVVGVRVLSPQDERSRLLSQAPLVADLLSAAVGAGAPIAEALLAVSESVDYPARGRLEAVRVAIDLGEPPATAWGELLEDDALAPIARAVTRSLHTGAPLAFVLDSAAEDMRQAHRADVTEAARSAGVRTVAPLALCFLPAYLLVGVVPVIAGFASSIFG